MAPMMSLATLPAMATTLPFGSKVSKLTVSPTLLELFLDFMIQVESEIQITPTIAKHGIGLG
jgi:hypothetical protein